MPDNPDSISILGFGCMRFPTLEDGSIIKDKAMEMLNHAFENGVNYYDTAVPYHGGRSEALVGEFIAGKPRDKVFIATKLPSWLINKPEDLYAQFEAQLQRLNTGYIDYYLVHSLNRRFWKPLLKNGLFDFLNDIKDKGLVRHIGFSFHDSLSLFKRIVDAYPWDFCQIMLNYLDTTYQAGLSGLRYAAKRNLGIIIMEPLRGGKLVDKIPSEIASLWDASSFAYTPAQRAFNWLWDKPEIHVVLSGMSSMEQVKQNIDNASSVRANSITPAEQRLYAKVRKSYLSKVKIDCSSCRYCLPCPNNLPIPFLFEMYNDAHIFEDKERHIREYKIWFDENTRADKCTACGACLAKCPREIPIPDKMKELAEFFV